MNLLANLLNSGIHIILGIERSRFVADKIRMKKLEKFNLLVGPHTLYRYPKKMDNSESIKKRRAS